ncbi:cytochrome c oxidase assembly protein [Microvirga guangxiensis]|uniref:Cytochrome c oxidase assembly protein CtaG n=1 Tax=Microvirga guangxiensis TaxID=549386 RepID=A0A1G5JMD1_9HYPH|nr:cytochrome c oxidase assembly protein [Microvirga guangxiensis]SCY89050.1 cytochrome c oxidase assembly protein subunit 11 [Microvirga guangxiensis]
MTEAPHNQRKMQRTAFTCLGIVVGMVGLAYASVPLYDLFCRVTGFDGTPIVRDSNTSQVVDRTIAVRFDANVVPSLGWRFSPEKPEVKVKLGETMTVYYKVTNTSDKPATGIATYNVQPDLAATYFSKLECFCFTEQTLQPGETLESAVVFYIDPRLLQDSDVKNISSITLSYTYFPSKAGKPVAEVTSSTTSTVQ